MKCYSLEQFTNQTLVSSVICEINKGVLNNPLMNSCGHAYCKSCVTNHLLTSEECPKCQTKIERNRLINSVALENILSSLETKCPNLVYGCMWSGPFIKRNEHTSDCLFKPSKCQFCEFLGCKSDILLHQDSCTQKMIPCTSCLKKVKLSQVKNHEANCENNLVNCSNGCSDKIKKKDMPFHISETCLLSRQKCSYSLYGCPMEGFLQEIMDHADDIRVTFYHSKIKLQYEKKRDDKMLEIISELNENCKQKLTDTLASVKAMSEGADLFTKEIRKVINPKNNHKKKKKEFSLMKAEKPKKSNNNKKNLDNLFEPELWEFKIKNCSSKNLKFSKFNKGDNIKISNKGLSVQGSNGHYELAVLSQKAEPYKHYVFSIEAQTSWICLGLVNLLKVQANNFQFRYTNVNHGCYFMFSNGCHIIDSRASFFCPPSYFMYTKGDCIDMFWEQKERRLVYTHIRTGAKSVLCLDTGAGNLYPAVHVFNNTCKVTLH